MAKDQKLIVILTGTTPDCRPHYVEISPASGWSELTVKMSGRGRGSGDTVAGFFMYFF
jgi:hypothetical protein